MVTIHHQNKNRLGWDTIRKDRAFTTYNLFHVGEAQVGNGFLVQGKFFW
jgi:hypothetical protein